MSRWLKTCMLVQVVPARDEYGVATEYKIRRRVRCNPFSMGAQSFYAAATSGVHPVATIQLYKCDYRGERTVEYDGATLNVDRVDASNPTFVVLTLTERVGERG